MAIDTQPRRLRFDVFELDLQTGELRRRGRRVRLQEQPSRLLMLLASRAGEVVTRAEIQSALWGDDQFVEFDHAINTAVRKIRKALGDDIEKPRLLETLPRKGYRFIGPVEAVSDRPPPIPGAVAEGKNPSAGEPTLTLSPAVARGLFLFIQCGYLALYASALYHLPALELVLARFYLVPVRVTLPLVIVTAMLGIAVRLYLISSVGLAHPAAGRKFHKLFPVLLVLDGLWTASPLLIGRTIGVGLALAGAAAMAYLPFSQKTLIDIVYR